MAALRQSCGLNLVQLSTAKAGGDRHTALTSRSAIAGGTVQPLLRLRHSSGAVRRSLHVVGSKKNRERRAKRQQMYDEIEPQFQSNRQFGRVVPPDDDPETPKDMWEGEQWDWLGAIAQNFFIYLGIMVVLVGAVAASLYNTGAVPVDFQGKESLADSIKNSIQFELENAPDL